MSRKGLILSRDNRIFKKQWIETATGLRMYTQISCELCPTPAPALVLVHGLSVSSAYMLPTAIRLAPFYRIYIPDLPGFGRSSKPAHILNITELADALAAWMQAMRLSSATLLGNSLGCQIIVQLALQHPECIERAILVSPTMDPQARTVHQQAGRLLMDMPYEPLHFLPILLYEYLEAGITRTICTLQYALDDPMEEHLPHVRIPSLVVRGSHDPIVSQTWAEKVNLLLPDSQLVVIEGAGHAVNLNHPDHLVPLIQSFVKDTAL